MVPNVMVSRLRLASLCVVFASGCGSAVLCAADAGDLPSFRAELSARIAEGDVGVGEAKDIARHLVDRQIETAMGPTGRRGLDAVASCAVRFDSALERRAAEDDELAAVATLILFDAGLEKPLSFMGYAKRPEPHWRAVGARSLGVAAPRPEDGGDRERLTQAGEMRRQLMLDPVLGVRLAALRAAGEAGDPADAAALLDAARRDPDPQARRLAIDAAGAVGSREAVLGLRDVWSRADEDERSAIASAWARAWRKPQDDGDPIGCEPAEQTPSCDAWKLLTHASDGGNGLPALTAALEIIAAADPAAATMPQANAAAVVERMIDDGPTRVRVVAIQRAPLSWPHLAEAVSDAVAKATDDQVVAAASTRALELGGKDRDAALAKLRDVAKQKGPAGELARQGLVAAGDATVVTLLDADAKAKSALTRARAAVWYANLGRVDRAVAMLGDADAHVRARAACAILEMD
jgi:hypothetical protein